MRSFYARTGHSHWKVDGTKTETQSDCHHSQYERQDRQSLGGYSVVQYEASQRHPCRTLSRLVTVFIAAAIKLFRQRPT